ncbi:MAG TPA: 1-(5-phosphoribosyl)-5-((5-phosphoribosylamino)methylideneamino)imidazole-4-carboxamide isomerase [Gallionella sp.]|nr:1-(5-phosphoribosyl)-5-((5-phosphoribosylamino)methylideneamino)imidazole-4-carboxamide isomerase [Gallionella sp.]
MIPTEITLHQQSRLLEIAFDDGARYKLPFEFLRVFSPSAEVRGHGVGQETLQVGKQNVVVKDLEPVGSYALKISFDDGHDSGLYTWAYLHELGQYQDGMWHDYLEKMAAAGESRD